jgi:hypothetical protein
MLARSTSSHIGMCMSIVVYLIKKMGQLFNLEIAMMSKYFINEPPKHFRQIEPTKSCDECEYSEYNIGVKAIVCIKNNFILHARYSTTNLEMLETTVCNNFKAKDEIF